MVTEANSVKVVNKVIPNKEQIMGFLEPGPDGPICMVNLLQFKPLAEYDDGRSTELTGREAYAVYEQGVKKLLKEVGGSIGLLKRQVEGSQNRNAVAGLDFAGIAHLAHGLVNFVDSGQKPGLAAFWAAQQVALAHDLNFELFVAHESASEGEFWGKRSIRASTRDRAAANLDLSRSRS